MQGDRPWRACAGGIELRVRVTPRGGADAVEGIEGSDLQAARAALGEGAPGP